MDPSDDRCPSLAEPLAQGQTFALGVLAGPGAPACGLCTLGWSLDAQGRRTPIWARA